MNNFLEFMLGIFCVWRITHLAVAEAGPFHVFARLRAMATKRHGSYWDELLGCHYCASLVIAAPVAAILAADLREGLLLWPALSTGSILLERFAKLHLPDFQEAPFDSKYETEQEEHHELLRTIRNTKDAEPETHQWRTGS